MSFNGFLAGFRSKMKDYLSACANKEVGTRVGLMVARDRRTQKGQIGVEPLFSKI
jgi:hypothetical protein